MTFGAGIAIAAVCAVPIAAMFADQISGSGFMLALIFAGFAITAIVING